MWNGTAFIYQQAFNNILLELVDEPSKHFFQEFVVKNPDFPDDQDFRPIFHALESYVIASMTRDYRNIDKKLIYEQFEDFLKDFASSLENDKDFVFLTINRDRHGNRHYAPHPPLPGVPELRIIFDLEDPEEAMSSADWAITPVRFLLHFRPLIQEYISDDSGVEE